MQKYCIIKANLEIGFRLMKYDFIEIGTSNFDTLIENSNETTVGISIEPLKVYLDQLPNLTNVIKINCAISLTGSTDPIDFYYIDPKQIQFYF